MKQITNPIAIAALNRVGGSIDTDSAPHTTYNSRNADKYVLRGFDELFNELETIARRQYRSMNSEAIAAIMEAFDGYRTSNATLSILEKHLGFQLYEAVLGEVPDFDLSICTKEKKFVIRFPPSVRDMIRDAVSEAHKQQVSKTSMNAWMLNALARWINYQHKHYALLSASITMEQRMLSKAG